MVARGQGGQLPPDRTLDPRGGVARSAHPECVEPTLTWGDGQAFLFVEIMHDFFAALPFWKLRPEPTLVNSESLCLADSGQTYVVYRQRGGSIVLDLTRVRSMSRFKGEWFDPRTGARLAADTVAGGAPRSFTCPDSQDWVLHLNAAL